MALVVIICPRLDRGWTVLETIAIPWKPFVSGLTIPAAADLVDIPLKSLTFAYNLRYITDFYWIAIQKICNQQGLVLVSVSAKCQRTCMYFPHNPENITKAKILYWGWEKERLCSPGFNLYGRVPFQSGLRARRELDPLILSSWSIFCTSFLCMEPLTKHFDHMITLDIQMQPYYIRNLCNQSPGYYQNSPCLQGWSWWHDNFKLMRTVLCLHDTYLGLRAQSPACLFLFLWAAVSKALLAQIAGLPRELLIHTHQFTCLCLDYLPAQKAPSIQIKMF